MPPNPDTKSHLNRWVLRGLVPAIPLVFFLLLEGLLRLFHYNPVVDHLFVPYQHHPAYLTTNPEAGRRYFSGGGYGAFGTQDVFLKTKPADGLRIFVLGGSTTAGYPYMYSGTFAAFVKQRLQSAYPAHTIEVINLGMTAVTSYTVREFARECLRQQPDLLILYTGHNEFYGALGSASTQAPLSGSSRSFTLLTLQLKDLKLFQLIQNLVRTVHTSLSGPATPDQGTLMARLARRQAIPWESPLYQRTRENFRANLEDILTWARRQQVPVLLGTLVSNLRDQHPFSSIPAPDQDAAALAEALARVEELLRVQALDSARRELDSLLAQQPTHARLYFQAGRCAELAGDTAAAGEYYRQARDYDGLRFRAGSDFNGVLEELARREGVWLCDLERGFRAVSPGGLIGKELLLEHLHPRLEGYFLMGKLLAGTILDHDLLEARGRRLPEPQPLPADSYFRETMAVTPLDLKIAQYRIDLLTSGWPFNTAGRILNSNAIVPRSNLERYAKAVLTRDSDYEKAHVRLAEDYLRQAQVDSAIREYQALAFTFPANDSPQRILARLHVQRREFDQALPHLQNTIRLVPDAYSYKWIGIILMNRQEHTRAIPHLERALKLDPGDDQAGYNLSGAYFLTGDTTRALRQLELLLEHNPDFPGAALFYRQLANTRKGS